MASFQYKYWTYDDGSVAVERIEKSLGADGTKQKEKKSSVLTKGSAAYNRFWAFCKKIEAGDCDDDGEVEEGRILCGIKYVRTPETEISPDQFPRILATLVHDQSQEAQAVILSVFSAILAAYVFRLFRKGLFMERQRQDIAFRAPIIAIPDHQTFEALRILIESLAVDTTPQKKGSSYAFSQPAVIQATRRGYTLNEYTRLCIAGILDAPDYSIGIKRKKAFPAQYRDTAVLIHTRNFAKKDLHEFQYRNPWATIFLYSPTSKVPIIDPIQINTRPLQTCSIDTLPADKLRGIMQIFLVWLADHKKYFDLAGIKREAEERISRYNKRPRTPSFLGHKKTWMLAQLVAIHVFLAFLHDVGGMDVSSLETAWWDVLLPLSKNQLPKSDPPPKEQELIPRPSSKELFEQTITEVIRQGIGSTILFLPSTDKLTAEEAWGCFRSFAGRGEDPQRVFAISSHQLSLLAQKYCPVLCNWRKVISDLRKKPPGYFLTKRNCRIFGSTDSVNAVLINIDKARFLPNDLRAIIKKHLK